MSKSFVYFIEAEGIGIKIGRARSPERRMAHLQVGSPLLLTLRRKIPGDQRVEWWLHQYFDADHIRGEWFRFNPEMDMIQPCAVEALPVRRAHRSPASTRRRDPERCIAGHMFTSENTYLPPRGGRKCRTCQLAHKRSYTEQRRADGIYTAPFPGVARTGPQRFRATIRTGGKTKHLGYFSTPEAAAAVYEAALLERRNAAAPVALSISASPHAGGVARA